MTRRDEKGKAGRAATKLADGLFKRGVHISNNHADPARDAESGPRVRKAQAAETKGLYSNGISIRNRARSAKRGR